MRTVTAVVLAIALHSPFPIHGQDNPAPSVGLHLAALQGNTEAIRGHIDAGSDLNEKDAWGSTPLIVAATFGRTEVARVLIEAGADLEIENNDGATALYVAAFLCRTATVRALLEGGANRHARTNGGRTALDDVTAPWEDVRGIYETIGAGLASLGLELDFERIRTTRPRIAEMLRPRTEELEAVEYAPLAAGDWKISTPAAQGLDPMLVAELYLDAAEMQTLYGLLVVKNGHLIAEGYFNDGAVDTKALLQSVTKSYTSALVGLALNRGCLASVDQKMIDFFPEFADRITDPRKERITIRGMLQRSDMWNIGKRPPQCSARAVAGRWWGEAVAWFY